MNVLFTSAHNIGKDTIFTLLMRKTESDTTNQNSKRILFSALTKNSRSEDDVNRRVLKLVHQLLTPNSCDLTARSMKETLDLSAGQLKGAEAWPFGP